MRAIAPRATTALRLRIVPGLLLALTSLPWVAGPAAPARADEPIIRDHRDPSARVLLVIKKIIVHDDMDWGNGEVNITFNVHTSAAACPVFGQPECGWTLVSGKIPQFAATDGWVQKMDRAIPGADDTPADSSIGPELGIPIRDGQWYGFQIKGVEDDPTSDDTMGTLEGSITAEDGHIQFGTFTERAIGKCAYHPIGVDFCAPIPASDSPPARNGAFSVEFEIKRVPLADLRPVNVTVHDLPGTSRKHVCMAVQNVEQLESGPFEVALRVDGVVPPQGRAIAASLAPGTYSETCIDLPLPTSGVHQLSAIVDEPGAVTEFNEKNNVSDERPYQGFGPSAAEQDPAPTSVASPGPILAAVPTATDLSVGAIKVNGRVPDGKDDCKDGKNTVAVVVKNAASSKAPKLAVRLTVDGDEVDQASVDGLDAGKEQEVRFEDVRLKKGEHKLTASVDTKGTVSEADEENNQRTVAVTC